MNLKKTLSVLLIIVILIVFNSIQAFTYYLARIGGDIDFYNPITHVTSFFNSVGSLIATLLAWNWLNRFKIKRMKFIYAFLVSLPLFAVYTSIFHVVIRAYYGGSTPVELLLLNYLFTLSFCHFYVSGFTIAYLFFSEANILKKKLLKTKYEIESLQLQMLKKNIEPHFLFNNLSVLSSLARKDVNQIDEFIEELADVYRYFLVHNSEDSVKLKDEITFLEKYISLTTRRFDKAYVINLEIDDCEGYIIPFALQIAVENAIKHNEASANAPLKIELTRKDNTICVSNQIRLIENSSNTGLGISNITTRYKLLFDKEVNVGILNDKFVIEIPVIIN